MCVFEDYQLFLYISRYICDTVLIRLNPTPQNLQNTRGCEGERLEKGEQLQEWLPALEEQYVVDLGGDLRRGEMAARGAESLVRGDATLSRKLSPGAPAGGLEGEGTNGQPRVKDHTFLEKAQKHQ